MSTDEKGTCPWCSASVPAETATCPSCGASLRAAADGDVRGVTQIDPAAIVRTRRIRSGKIAAFLGIGDAPEVVDSGGTVGPPSEEVRREMLRMELAAIEAELEMKAKGAEVQRAIEAEDSEHAADGSDTPADGSGTVPNNSDAPADEPDTAEPV